MLQKSTHCRTLGVVFIDAAATGKINRHILTAENGSDKLSHELMSESRISSPTKPNSGLRGVAIDVPHYSDLSISLRYIALTDTYIVNPQVYGFPNRGSIGQDAIDIDSNGKPRAFNVQSVSFRTVSPCIRDCLMGWL